MPVETAEPPMTEEKTKALKNVFDDILGDAPSTTAAPTEQELHDAELPPLDKKVEMPPAKVADTKVVEDKKTDDKKSDITRRLAPDFTSVTETTKDATKTTETERPAYLKDLDAEIESTTQPKKKANLTAFRDKLETLEKENITLRARPAPVADDSAGLKPVVEKLEKEKADLEERIGRFDLTQRPQFQRDYFQPRQKAFDEARNILKEAGADPVELEKAMALRGKARTDLLEELTEKIPGQMMRGRFERMMETVDQKTRDIEEAIKNHREKNAEYQHQETVDREKNIQKQTGEIKTLLSAAHRELLENVKLEVLQKTGNKDFEWWDKQADEIQEVAEEVLLKSTPEKAAIAAYLAASAGPFRSLWQAEREARIAAEKRLEEYESASPGLGKERVSKASGEFAADADMADVITEKLRRGT